MVDYGTTSKGYAHLWDDAKLREGYDVKMKQLIETHVVPVELKQKYLDTEKACGVPWFMVAALHMRESDFNFKTHLHNGDSLQGYTHHVPAGRPKVGHGPPFTFSESAQDALTMPPHSLKDVKVWSVERILYEMERYNGFGYIKLRENSPYVWSWTTEQQPGKYVADGQFSRSAWDTQPGCAALLKELAAIDEDVKRRLEVREGAPPKEVIQRAQQQGKKVAVAGVGLTAGSGTVVAINSGDKVGVKHYGHAPEVWLALGGVVVVVVGILLIGKRVAVVKDKWLGK